VLSVCDTTAVYLVSYLYSSSDGSEGPEGYQISLKFVQAVLSDWISLVRSDLVGIGFGIWVRLQNLYFVCVCVCFLPIHSGHQVRWTYQPGSHRRKVTQDFSSTFFVRCVP
ncbi:unnamed protein product, partial [Ascophyllum nodosum]